MFHFKGNAVFDSVPIYINTHHYELVCFLAKSDRANYPALLWYLKYLNLAFRQPDDRSMPIP